MKSKLALHHPEKQVCLDSAFPGMREKYCDEPVYLEAELFAWLKQNRIDRLESGIKDMLTYFFDERGTHIEFDTGDGNIGVYLDDNEDNEVSKFYMILMKES